MNKEIKKIRIGYYFGGYPDKRNIIDIVPNYNYKKVYDINKIIQYLFKFINNKVFKKKVLNSIDLNFSFKDFNLNKVDIIHFFNAVSYGKTPWMTTFETIVPRYKSTLSYHHGENCDYSPLKNDRKINRALEALAGDSCKKLIAMSKCNLNMQKDFLKHFPKYSSKIEQKMMVIHPSQQLFIKKHEVKVLNSRDQIHFIFVGRSFFRKGGREMLAAFKELKKNFNFKLTIISRLDIDNYATKENNEDVLNSKEIIGENKDWIDYYDYLPNQKVLEIMKLAHIGLLPTHADTYGYSVLEFQASGCPVISTNIRALPEINNNEIGWLIDVPKNRLGEAIYSTQKERDYLSSVIKEGLKLIIIEIMNNKSSIHKKSLAALDHIEKNHSPEKYSIKLGEIYNKEVSH
jgi:glycosyltransferase involved in cell wall biosynthesis